MTGMVDGGHQAAENKQGQRIGRGKRDGDNTDIIRNPADFFQVTAAAVAHRFSPVFLDSL